MEVLRNEISSLKVAVSQAAGLIEERLDRVLCAIRELELDKEEATTSPVLDMYGQYLEVGDIVHIGGITSTDIEAEIEALHPHGNEISAVSKGGSRYRVKAERQVRFKSRELKNPVTVKNGETVRVPLPTVTVQNDWGSAAAPGNVTVTFPPASYNPPPESGSAVVDVLRGFVENGGGYTTKPVLEASESARERMATNWGRAFISENMRVILCQRSKAILPGADGCFAVNESGEVNWPTVMFVQKEDGSLQTQKPISFPVFLKDYKSPNPNALVIQLEPPISFNGQTIEVVEVPNVPRHYTANEIIYNVEIRFEVTETVVVKLPMESRGNPNGKAFQAVERAWLEWQDNDPDEEEEEDGDEHRQLLRLIANELGLNKPKGVLDNVEPPDDRTVYDAVQKTWEEWVEAASESEDENEMIVDFVTRLCNELNCFIRFKIDLSKKPQKKPHKQWP